MLLTAAAPLCRIIREVGAASTVLLKNSKGTLPLSDDLRSIAVIGNDAGPSLKGANGYADRGGLDGVLGMGCVLPLLGSCDLNVDARLTLPCPRSALQLGIGHG